MSLTITILGCGSSAGVPRVGQGWGACDPNNPKNRRRRCSILVERAEGGDAKTQVLVDTSPDLRDQLLGLGVSRLDGILLTHAHADHIHGMDDVRPLVIMARRKIDIHMDAPTSARVRTAFSYIFETPPGSQYPALLNEHRLFAGESVTIDGPGGAVEALPFQLEHGDIDALGFRFGNVAYSPDLNAIPVESRGFLEGLDIWIVDALRYTPHPSHFSLPETLDWIAKLRPKRAILTNMHTDLDFERLKAELPANIEPAFDGMQILA
ncbi:MBL fold metallo-hydrolase [Methylocapsa acidiphila]|uniref:MBL fold metallo-hydrolase n=1 Tax=Methylocapsa acidiphila TaxID=133552 RepID=UPI0004220C80|nr:MBL fold metallo-hydrolase [Methylocapsa acidiphila]